MNGPKPHNPTPVLTCFGILWYRVVEHHNLAFSGKRDVCSQGSKPLLPVFPTGKSARRGSAPVTRSAWEPPFTMRKEGLVPTHESSTVPWSDHGTEFLYRHRRHLADRPTPMTDPLNINTTLQPLWPNWYMILCYWLASILWAWVIMAEFLLRLPMSVSTAQRIVHHRLGIRIVWHIVASSCVLFHFMPPLQPSVFFYISCLPLFVVTWWGAGYLRVLDLKA